MARVGLAVDEVNRPGGLWGEILAVDEDCFSEGHRGG